MNTRLIRGNLNSNEADDNPELRKLYFLSVETLYQVSFIKIKRKSRLQTILLVVKTIVVRNLFSYEYDGSNPSLPTNDVSVRTNRTD